MSFDCQCARPAHNASLPRAAHSLTEPPAVLAPDGDEAGDGLVTTQHMVERRCVHAIRMRALRGLIELLRIAQQDDGLRRL